MQTPSQTRRVALLLLTCRRRFHFAPCGWEDAPLPSEVSVCGCSRPRERNLPLEGENRDGHDDDPRRRGRKSAGRVSHHRHLSLPDPFYGVKYWSDRAREQIDRLEAGLEGAADVVGLDPAELFEVFVRGGGVRLPPDRPDVEHPAPGDRSEDAGTDPVGRL